MQLIAHPHLLVLLIRERPHQQRSRLALVWPVIATRYYHSLVACTSLCGWGIRYDPTNMLHIHKIDHDLHARHIWYPTTTNGSRFHLHMCWNVVSTWDHNNILTNMSMAHGES
jgi:hypothetical protein